MSQPGKRVVVIGAQGTLGRICSGALREAGFDVLRAGRRAEDSPDFRLIDLDDPRSIAAGIRDVDVVVSTVRHPARTAERVVLREGGTLLNVASLTLADRAELKQEMSSGPGLVVVHAGLLPGVGSLLVKDLLTRRPEADGVEVAACFSMVQASGPAGTVDFAYPALTSAKRHPTKVIQFPAPIGRRRCMLVGGEEIGFFGEAAAGRSARVYFTVLQRSAQAEFLALNKIGLLSRMPLSMFQLGRKWTSRRTTHEPKRDVVSVTREGKTLEAACIEGSGDYVMTATATVVFARALLRLRAGEPSRRGVVGAEEIFTLDQLQADFETGGTKITPVAP